MSNAPPSSADQSKSNALETGISAAQQGLALLSAGRRGVAPMESDSLPSTLALFAFLCGLVPGAVLAAGFGLITAGALTGVLGGPLAAVGVTLLYKTTIGRKAEQTRRERAEFQETLDMLIDQAKVTKDLGSRKVIETMRVELIKAHVARLPGPSNQLLLPPPAPP